MKRILLIALALISGICSAPGGALAQTFKVQNLDVLGTSTLTGLASFTVRPQFNGNTPWDSGNFNPSSYLTTAAAASTYAPIASPTFTGVPAAPTAATGTNTTQLATTAFAQATAPCVSIMAYGGNNGGVVDNAAAFNSAISAASTAGAGQICVEFPAGNFKFASSVSATVPALSSITIKGQGNDVTNLIWPSTSGLTINLQSGYSTLHVRDMSLLTSGHIAGDALTVNQINGQQNEAYSDITNVTCHGLDGYGLSNVWSTCVLVNGVSFINFTNLNSAGSSALEGQGVALGASLPSYGIVYNFQGCNFEQGFIGIFYGNYIQGVTVNQSNFTAVVDGILVPPSALGVAQLTVTGSQFNATDNGIIFQSNMPATAIIGNYFFCDFKSTSICFSAFQPGLIQVVGNIFQGASLTNQYGISFTSGSGTVTVTGNTFFRLGVGILLPAGTGSVNVQSNGYTTNVINVSNSGSNTIGGGSP